MRFPFIHVLYRLSYSQGGKIYLVLSNTEKCFKQCQNPKAKNLHTTANPNPNQISSKPFRSHSL
jgi:hypothetical protein